MTTTKTTETETVAERDTKPEKLTTCERCDEMFQLEDEDDEPMCGPCIEEDAAIWADVMAIDGWRMPDGTVMP